MVCGGEGDPLGVVVHGVEGAPVGLETEVVEKKGLIYNLLCLDSIIYNLLCLDGFLIYNASRLLVTVLFKLKCTLPLNIYGLLAL